MFYIMYSHARVNRVADLFWFYFRFSIYIPSSTANVRDRCWVFHIMMYVRRSIYAMYVYTIVLHFECPRRCELGQEFPELPIDLAQFALGLRRGPLFVVVVVRWSSLLYGDLSTQSHASCL